MKKGVGRRKKRKMDVGKNITKEAVSLTLDISLVRKLREEAREEGRSLSNYVNTVLLKRRKRDRRLDI